MALLVVAVSVTVSVEFAFVVLMLPCPPVLNVLLASMAIPVRVVTARPVSAPRLPTVTVRRASWMEMAFQHVMPVKLVTLEEIVNSVIMATTVTPHCR